MALNWFQNLLYGAVSGVTEILPVSAQAHRLILRKIFGTDGAPDFTLLLIHVGILAALYMCCQNHILKMLRARRLSKIPKKKRKRPLDGFSLMDYSLLRTMAIPVILAFLFFRKTSAMENNIIFVSVFLLLNGILLYAPQFFPGSNKDSRSLSRVEGLLIGLGGAAAAIPGISGIAATVSVAQICGVDRTYGLNMALLLEHIILIGLIVMDVFTLAAEGIPGFTFALLIQSLLAAAAAFGTALLAVRFLRKLASQAGFNGFAYYCWGVALFSMILTLFA